MILLRRLNRLRFPKPLKHPMPDTPTFRLLPAAARACLALAVTFSLTLPGTLAARAQMPKGNIQTTPPKPQQRVPKPPALLDAAGPAVTLESSEAMFDVAVAMNACGYDAGLAESDPVRKEVRELVNQAAQGSATARDARDQLCSFINQHRLFEGGRDLAQYVSLALYLTPPPELKLSVDEGDLPPDATQVDQMLPTLRTFADAIQLHLIWLRVHPEYEQEIIALHDPLTKMILDTNFYLKQPASTYTGSRFLVVLEPMLDPAQTNARVYGSDYVVVASPVQGQINMHDVRHTYLHYEIEPLLYAHSGAMDRLLPILKTVREAPLDFEYRADITSLVIECMIRAVEARTMATDVKIFQIPADANRADLPRLQREHDESVQQSDGIRAKAVNTAMTQGFVLTRYFYNQLGNFAHNPESLSEAIGPMVYGMDVDSEVHAAKQVAFAEVAPSDVIRNPVSNTGLDKAETLLKSGDADGASKLAMTALKDHTADPARADYVLALTWLMKGDMDSATNDFKETLRLTQDPRLLAWSHIYLGRIADVQDQRPDALAQYKEAMTVRDGQQDTLAAAQKGLNTPYTLPHSGGDSTESASPQQ